MILLPYYTMMFLKVWINGLSKGTTTKCWSRRTPPVASWKHNKRWYLSSRKGSSSQKAAEFQTAIVNAKNLTEKKRVYFSDYGFANSREVIRGDTDKLEKNPINFDKFYQENLIKWWKNKASKRYESLKSNNSLRRELEVWTKDMHIDIIR